jgi:hypothetical protein
MYTVLVLARQTFGTTVGMADRPVSRLKSFLQEQQRLDQAVRSHG